MGSIAKHVATAAATAALAFALVTSARAQEAEKIDRSAKFDLAQIKRAAGGAIPTTQLPKAPADGQMAFVISELTPAVYPGWEACPLGWAMTNKEEFLSTVSAPERARLTRPENEKELTEKWKAYTTGPNNTNVCTNYNRFPERPLATQVQSKVAYGLDLDSDRTKTCEHASFVSPLGEKGLDNQVYRALGCTRTYRGSDGANGEIIPGYKSNLTTGQFTVVMILRGVDSLVNDPEVEVILASSDQQPIVDAQQNFIADASYNVSPNPRWRNVLHGRIVDGVLTTDSKNVLLLRARGMRSPVPGKAGDWEWDWVGARLRLALRPNGTLEGLVGAYEDPVDLLRYEIGGGRGTAQTAGTDCASKYNTLVKLADGGRDPDTGKCTRDSNAYRVTAAPAFVFDRPPSDTKTAAR